MDWLPSLGVSFSHPEHGLWLGFVLVVAALMARSAQVRARARRLLGIVAGDFDFAAPVNRPLKNLLFLLGLFFVALAAMGPQWGQKMHPVKAQGLDLCFAIDLSRSMLAEDIAPSRLQQAKNQLEIFLPRLGGDRAALVGFAGSAYVAAPLSVDHGSVATFMEPMNPDIISDQSTELSSGVEACLSALGLDAVKDRNQILDDAAKLVVLISDGEETANDDTGAVTRAEKLGVPVFAMAVGTAKGAPIPLRENGELKSYLKDPSTGQPVLSKLEEKGLQKIVKQTGGQIFYASNGIEAWKSFESAISDYKRASRDAGTKLDKEERFQWPLLAGFMCLLLDFLLTETKWSWKLTALLLLLAPALGRAAESGTASPSLSRTASPSAVWWNNKAVKAFRKKDLKQADEQFLKSLGEDAADPQARYNWAANKLHAAMPKEKESAQANANSSAASPPAATAENPDTAKAAAEAARELERLAGDPALQRDPALRRKTRYQLGQAYEMLKETPKALANYYEALPKPSDPTPSGEKAAKAWQEFDKNTKDNIARLLVAPPQKDGGGSQQDQQQQQQDKGEQEKQKQGGQGDQKKDQQSKLTRGDGGNKPKFSGTDVSEGEAQQILESVSGEEKEVLKRKARGEAQESARRNRDAKDQDSSAGRGKAW